MKTMYLDMWDNYDRGDPDRERIVQEVLETVMEEGEIAVSFSYSGRTRHESASHAMIRRLKELTDTLEYTVGYNYHFTIRKKVEED